MATISVIIPLYNKGKYIARALDSVFAQTYQDFEVIVVDDGSTDEGPEIVQQYRDSRLRLIPQANAGPAAARNRGVRESTGPWVAFLDADDEWLPDFLRVSMEALERHPECTVSVSSRYEGHLRKDITPGLKEYGLRTGVWFLREGSGVTSLEQSQAAFFTSAVVCRHDVFERYGGFYDQTRVVCGEDTYLWLQLVVNCRIFMILRPLVWYHYEASALGHCWNKAGVLQPYYSDPEPIRKNCPREHRPVLDEYLTRCAARRVSELCLHRDGNTAKQVLDAFPSLRRPLWRYAKLRMKVYCPWAYQIFRCIHVALWHHRRKAACAWL